MNGPQLQDWLVDIHQTLNSSIQIKNNEMSSAEVRKTLRQFVNNSKILTNYLICNFEDTELIQPLISQLLAIYYRFGISRYFVIQTLPSFFYVYLRGLQHGQDSLVSVFEMLFVAIYNEEILAEGPGAENFNKRVDQVRVPSIRFPSVYHDPNKLNTFPEFAEFRNNTSSAVLCSVQIGPYPAVESLVGGNRYVVLSRLIKLVSSSLPYLALDVVCVPFCEAISDIARAGFPFKESDFRKEILVESVVDLAYPELNKEKRIFSPSHFYIEALTVINFCIFNGFANSGIRALDFIHLRAIYDISADILLVTNSMRDLLAQEDSTTLIREVEDKSISKVDHKQNGDT